MFPVWDDAGGKMLFYEDFQVGDKIVTRARTITESDIISFASLSGDWYPLHVNVVYAKKSPFGERIAHGFLVLSVASGLMPLTEWALVAFYGMDRVRFINPTRIGDTLHVELEVREKRDKGDVGGVVVFDQRIKAHDGGEKASCDFLALIAHREAGRDANGL